MINSSVLEVLTNGSWTGVVKETNRIQLKLDLTGLDQVEVERKAGSDLMDRHGLYCPEVEGVLLGFDDLVIRPVSSGKRQMDVKNSLVVVEGDFYVMKLPDVGSLLLCTVSKVTEEVVTCSLLAGTKVQVYCTKEERRELYLGQSVLCQVFRSGLSPCQTVMEVKGMLVGPVTSISLQADTAGDISQTQKRQMESSVSPSLQKKIKPRSLAAKFASQAEKPPGSEEEKPHGGSKSAGNLPRTEKALKRRFKRKSTGARAQTFRGKFKPYKMRRTSLTKKVPDNNPSLAAPLGTPQKIQLSTAGSDEALKDVAGNVFHIKTV